MAYSIKSLIENLLSELGKNDIQYKGKISKFLVDNNGVFDYMNWRANELFGDKLER